MSKGFNRPQGGSGMGMMGQLKKLQEQMEAAQEQLAVETTTASVGGGAVKVTVTGDQKLTTVFIDPELLTGADAEMLQDLILSAVNLGLDQSRAMAAEKLGPLAGGLGGLGF
jgi:DNA-binding YbaB/EbfC family protein